MLKQSLQQRLLQKLSPQQIQLMKLLQVPTAMLEERVKEEIESNPALEYESDSISTTDDYTSDDTDSEFDNETDFELSDDGSEKIDLDDYIREESGDHYYNDDYGDDNDKLGYQPSTFTTFHDHLHQQLLLCDFNETDSKIAEQIIGSIDGDGYLRRETYALVDDIAFGQNLSVEESDILRILAKIQQFDPAGVGARDLQECLVIQIKRLPQNLQSTKWALEVIEKYFEEFKKKHFPRIQKLLGIDDALFKEVIELILKLNPRPGSAFEDGDSIGTYVIPDFFIYNNQGRLELSLNAKNAPELRVSEGYKEMLIQYDQSKNRTKKDKEAVMFIKQKLDSAKWFIDAIKQRQHTLMQTMHAIMEYQSAFFMSGLDTDLKPMILKDIAERTNLDISTVSRVANSKFVQTEFGTYPLKHFFSESLQTDSGEEVSSREVKSILSDLISNENPKKPLSDNALTDMLTEKGYNIARRTVAKYREQLGIPVARLRKGV